MGVKIVFLQVKKESLMKCIRDLRYRREHRFFLPSTALGSEIVQLFILEPSLTGKSLDHSRAVCLLAIGPRESLSAIPVISGPNHIPLLVFVMLSANPQRRQANRQLLTA